MVDSLVVRGIILVFHVEHVNLLSFYSTVDIYPQPPSHKYLIFSLSCLCDHTGAVPYERLPGGVP